MKLSTEGLPCVANPVGRENVTMMFTDVKCQLWGARTYICISFILYKMQS